MFLPRVKTRGCENSNHQAPEWLSSVVGVPRPVSRTRWRRAGGAREAGALASPATT